jgi:hypothetical protein
VPIDRGRRGSEAEASWGALLLCPVEHDVPGGRRGGWSLASRRCVRLRQVDGCFASHDRLDFFTRRPQPRSPRQVVAPTCQTVGVDPTDWSSWSLDGFNLPVVSTSTWDIRPSNCQSFDYVLQSHAVLSTCSSAPMSLRTTGRQHCDMLIPGWCRPIWSTHHQTFSRWLSLPNTLTFVASSREPCRTFLSSPE